MSEMKDELNREERRRFIYPGKFMIYMQASVFSYIITIKILIMAQNMKATIL